MEFKKDEFRIAMIKKHINMAETAELIGIKPSSLSKKVNGASEWKLGEMKKVAEIFGTEAAHAIFFEG